MLRLRPYNKNDAEIIMSWIKGENAFYKWTAGVLGEYPISVHFALFGGRKCVLERLLCGA